jgi:hypothetical protein
MADGTCDCEGNVFDSCGVCGGSGTYVDECGVCDGPGAIYECGCDNLQSYDNAVFIFDTTNVSSTISMIEFQFDSEPYEIDYGDMHTNINRNVSSLTITGEDGIYTFDRPESFEYYYGDRHHDDWRIRSAKSI